MKKIVFLFVLLIGFQSCQYFEKNVPTKDELLQKELKKINWEEVDEYPSTAICDSITNKNLRKQCFFDYMSAQLRLKLANDTIRKAYKNPDTLHIKVMVTAAAKVSFESYFEKDSLDFEKNKADSILQVKLRDFPAIEPAIKRGVKVKSEFLIPIALHK
jgi:hydroxylamine reductase (hybrid-cluster protein)